MKKILVIFGGVSSEYDISLKSAKNICGILYKDYELVMVGITKTGKFKYVRDVEDIIKQNWVNSKEEVLISQSNNKKIYILNNDQISESISIDVALPVLHGRNGEDGTIAGLFAVSGIPYVGSNCLSGSVAMDKKIMKDLASQNGINQAPYEFIDKLNYSEGIKNIEKALESKKLIYPLYVKPANAGSSCGITKVFDYEGLIKAIDFAFEYDYRVLVEKGIDGRELECAIITSYENGVRKEIVSNVGEIIDSDFYDFDEKYNSDVNHTLLTPNLDKDIEEEIRNLTKKVFNLIDGYSLSRVDFFLEKDTNKIIFNEINTFPGFTNISMFSMLLNHIGIDTKTQLKMMIESAFYRYG